MFLKREKKEKKEKKKRKKKRKRKDSFKGLRYRESSRNLSRFMLIFFFFDTKILTSVFDCEKREKERERERKREKERERERETKKKMSKIFV